MRMDKEPVDDTKVDSESSDLEDVCDIKSSPSSPKRVLSPALSLSEGERTEIDDSDNDSGFVGVSHGSLDRLDTVTPDVEHDTNGCRVAESRINETYNREAILNELASFETVYEAQLIKTIERTRKNAVKFGSIESTESSIIFQDEYPEAEIPSEECLQSKIERFRGALQAIPDSMLHLLVASKWPGDCGRPYDQKPDWLDMDKLRRGQKFAQDHMFSVYFSELLSLFALFSFEQGLKPLIITGKSSTPYAAFRRYLSTGLRIRHWYTEDPWTKGTAAHKDILTVRAMHAATKRRLDTSTNEEIDAAAIIPDACCPTREILLKDFGESCQAPEIGQCPYMLHPKSPHRPKGINQSEMALTQWGFVGLITSYPKALGVHYATDEDLEAFCHLWRSIGYQLGMEDKFNFCRGTLEEIRQRSRDFVETWVKPNLREITPEWEHMMRCIFTGTSQFLTGTTYETALLYMAEILDLPMPRLYASLSYKDWINHNLVKSLFYYTIKLPGMSRLINVFLNRALDRAEKFTPEELETIRIKLSKFSVEQ